MNYFSIQIDNYLVFIYSHLKKTVLNEANPRGIPLVGPYSVLKHPPHIPSGMYHLHIYKRQNHIFAINFNGTAHDGSHNVRIPNRVASTLRNKFPNLVIPPNNMIEGCDLLSVIAVGAVIRNLLLENKK